MEASLPSNDVVMLSCTERAVSTRRVLRPQRKVTRWPSSTPFSRMTALALQTRVTITHSRPISLEETFITIITDQEVRQALPFPLLNTSEEPARPLEGGWWDPLPGVTSESGRQTLARARGAVLPARGDVPESVRAGPSLPAHPGGCFLIRG